MASGRRRFLAGCVILAGVGLVVAVIAVWWGLSWVREEAPLPAAEHPLLTGEETSYFSLILEAGDEGCMQLAESALAVLRRHPSAAEIGLGGRSLEAMGRSEPREALAFYMPLRVVALQRDRDPEDVRLAAVGFSKGYHAFRLLFGLQIQELPPEIETQTYAGETLVVDPAAGAVVFAGSHLVFAGDAGTARWAVDRLAASTPGRIAALGAELGDLVGSDAAETDLWGFHLRPERLTPPDVPRGGEAEPMAGLDGIAFAVDIYSAESARGLLALRTHLPVVPRDRAGRVGGVLATFRSMLDEDLTLETVETTWPDPRTALVEGELHGLQRAVADRLDAVLDEAIVPPNPD